MTTVAVEIHDAGLGLVSDDPGWERVPESPGYALVDGDRLLVGAEALARARLQPRQVHHRFWHELDFTPLPRPFPPDLTASDLAHAHLEAIWSSVGGGVDSVLLAVPGTFSARQLGIALGLARACGMPVVGLVDSAVAAAVGAPCEGKVVHVDLHLHQAVLTELAVGRQILRRRSEIEEQVGLVAIQDAVARRIARLFVHSTRFDPLHSAAAEQELFLASSGWLEQLAEAETVDVSLASASREVGLELPRREVLAAVEPFADRLVERVRSLRRAGEPVTLLVSHHAATLPGLTARLAELRDAVVTILPAGAAAAGALAAQGSIRATGDELPFITTLPAAGGGGLAPLPSVESPPALPGPLPTHLLFGSQAHPLDEEPLVLGTAVPGGRRGIDLPGESGNASGNVSTAGISRVHCSLMRRGDRVVLEDHSTYGTFLNDERVHGRVTVTVGDRLRLGSPGVELRLIRVVDAEAGDPDAAA